MLRQILSSLGVGKDLLEAFGRSEAGLVCTTHVKCICQQQNRRAMMKEKGGVDTYESRNGVSLPATTPTLYWVRTCDQRVRSGRELRLRVTWKSLGHQEIYDGET